MAYKRITIWKDYFMEHLSPLGVGAFRISCISSSSGTRLKDKLRSEGFGIYSFDSASICDKPSLLQALKECFSLEIPQGSSLTSWDAFSDLVWQQLMEQPSNRVVLFWENAHSMLNGRLGLMLDALEVLQSVGDTVEKQEKDDECHPVLLRIVLEGMGPNFGAS
jgi:hypothetical protein